MLCVDRNIPIMGTTEDGNASDKTLKNELLGGISRHMARRGLEPGAFVYVADSAFVTPDNLQKAQDNNVKFITRLPATYKECARAIAEAIAADDWIDFGTLNKTRATLKRPAAEYRGYETTVELYGQPRELRASPCTMNTFSISGSMWTRMYCLPYDLRLVALF
jgi:transposase